MFTSAQRSKLGLLLPVSLFLWNRGGLVIAHHLYSFAIEFGLALMTLFKQAKIFYV